MIKYLLKFLLILVLITGWIFSGFPRIWQNPPIPPKIEKAYALNQLANPDFDTDASSWTTSADTSTSDTCGAAGTAASAGMATFAYYGADGNPSGSFRARSGVGNNARYKSYIYQSITVPGSGTVLVQSRFDYSATSSTWRASNVDGHIKLKLYDSSNATFLANMACVQLPGSNVSWTAVSSSTAYSATGGTTYVVRATIAYRNSGTSLANIMIDNIILTAAPTGLAASAPAGTKNAQLDWTASAAGSGAAGLHSTEPYQVYRNTSSPVSLSNILATSTTNSYTNTSTTGNTTYYYAIRNYDSNNIPSPLSAEASILTRPDAPGIPTFTNVQSTSLTVNWVVPAGSSTSYKIERCTGSGCSSFSEIASGVVAAFYNDSSLASNTTYRYRIRGTNASGDGPYSSADETTTTAPSLTFVVSTNNFPTITPDSPVFATTTLSVDTNNSTGWNVTLSGDDVAAGGGACDLDADASVNLTDLTPQWINPTATTTVGNAVTITLGDNVLGFRVMTASGSVPFRASTWWGGADGYPGASLWAGIASSTVARKIGNSSVSCAGANCALNTVIYYLDVPDSQQQGAYSCPLTYTATMNP